MWDDAYFAERLESVPGIVVRDEVGLSLDKVGGEVLGTAARVVLAKETTTIVGDGSTQDAVNKRVAQVKSLAEVHIHVVLCILFKLFWGALPQTTNLWLVYSLKYICVQYF